MPLIDFSNDLKKYRQFPNLVNYLDYVSSFHFLNLIQAKEKLYDMVYEIVSDKFIKVAKN